MHVFRSPEIGGDRINFITHNGGERFRRWECWFKTCAGQKYKLIKKAGIFFDGIAASGMTK
jgi:hypothetical protein